jgi:Prokaryotic Cytochrome C oxidase subunit IV
MMTAYARGPLLYTWLFLVAATVLSWWLGLEKGAELHRHASTAITVSILAIAIVKCRFVIRNYMEVRFAPTWLQVTCDAWLVSNFGMVASFYWFVI